MSKKSKSTTGPSAFAKPYITGAAGALQSAYQAAQPGINQLTQQTQGLAGQLYDQTQQTNPLLAQSQGYVSDVLSGKYMQGNPYLEQNLAQTRANTIEGVGSMFAGAGRYGSGQMDRIASEQIANAENTARMANYEQEMGRMGAAAASTPGQIAAEYIPLEQYRTTAALGAELPYAGVNPYVSGIGGLMGNYNTTTGKQGGLGSILGAAGQIGGMALMASDPRLKTAIKKVGELDDGLGVYEYDYIWGGPRQRGVMADEVAALRPWALGPLIGGEYMTVNYGAL